MSVIAKVSLRQLQWWDEEGVVHPAHIGHSRQYTQQQLLQIVAIAAMRRHELSLQTIRKHLRKITTEIEASTDSLAAGTDVLLLVNRKSVEVIHDPSDIRALMIASVEAWHLISMQRELNQGRKKKAA